MGPSGLAIQQSSQESGLNITLQDIADSLEDDLLVIDADYRIRFANKAARSRLQHGTEPPAGRHCYEVFYGRERPCAAPLWECPMRSVLASGRMTEVIHPARTEGREMYLKVSAYPLRDSQGVTRAVVELRRDVTAERRLETQILRQHHRLLALNRISRAVSGVHDLDSILTIALDNVLEVIGGATGGILLVDEKARDLCYRVQRGLSAKYVTEMRIPLGEGIAGRVALTGEPMLLEDLSADPRAARRDLISAEGLRGFISIPLKSQNRVVGVMNLASQAVGRFNPDDASLVNSIGYYLGAAIEQARLNGRLAEAGERYRTLLQHALTAQEDERKRIARELHDSISQTLTSLALNLSTAIEMAKLAGVEDSDFLGRLEKIHSRAMDASSEMSDLIRALRPTLLDELGLPAAIERYAKDTLQAQGIGVTTTFTGMDKRLQPEVEVTFFRVAQGLMGNILKHAEAKNASIRLEYHEKECVLWVADDGKGFDVDSLTRIEPCGRGVGLFTIEERVKLVGGASVVQSEPGKGTRVHVSIPIDGDV